MIRRTVAAAAAFLALLATASAAAQAWPSKPLRIYVGSAPGSAPDTILRLVSERLSRRLGQPVVVENRPGAGGMPGTVAGARAPADGHHFLFGLGSALAMNQFLYKSLPYDPEKDFTPIVGVGTTPMVIAVHPELPVRSLRELIALAQAKPGTVRLGTTAKSAAHLTMASLAQQTGTHYLHVFYRSAPDALRDAMGGQVDVFSDALAAVPNLADPRIRVLAVTAPKRLPTLPDIPAVAETVPGFTSYGWYALMGPAGVAPDVVRALNREVNEVLREPAVVARLAELVTFDAGGTPEQLAEFIRTERARLRRAAASAKIEME